MNRARRFARIAALAWLVFLPTSLLFAQEQIPCDKALREEDVVKLLTAEVPEARIKQFVTCGVDFDLTPEVEQRFRQLGATDGVILALARAPRPDPAQKVLHRAIEAMGGQEVLRDLRSIIDVGTLVRTTAQGEERGTGKWFYLAPDKMRADYSYPSEKFSVILNVERMWGQTSTKTEELPHSEAKRMRASLEGEFELLLPAAAEGRWRVELLGSGIVAGHDVDILLATKLKSPDGGSVDADDPYSRIKLYVDKTTGRIVKKSRTERNQEGALDEEEVVYSDFRRVGSLIMAFSGVTHRNGNKVFEWNTESVEINTPIDADIFSVKGQSGQSSPSQNAMLTGSVYVESGEPVAGATVRLHNRGTGWVETASTDVNGTFTFASVPRGEDYVVEVQRGGYVTVIRPGLTLKPNENKLLLPPFVLQPVAPLTQAKGLSLREILELLEGGVQPRRIVQIVQEKGVNFNLTTEAEERLRAAGATDELLLAIARGRR